MMQTTPQLGAEIATSKLEQTKTREDFITAAKYLRATDGACQRQGRRRWLPLRPGNRKFSGDPRSMT